MKRLWPLVAVIVIAGCGDSKTASLEREVDRLQRQAARLEAENAELRERANALSLDLDHQRFLNNELQTKLRGARTAVEPERRAEEPAAEPAVAVPEERVEAPKPAIVPSPVSPPSRVEPLSASPRAPPLPEIRPKPLVAKPATPLVPPPAAKEAEKPATTADDPFAAFRKPGFREPAAAGPAATAAKPQPASATPPKPEAAEAPEPPRPAVPEKPATRVSAPPSDLQLVDVTESRDGDSVHVSGYVANNTDKPVLRVRVKAVFLDADGHEIASGEYAVSGGARMEARNRAAFTLVSPANAAIMRWRLTVFGDQVTRD